MIKNIDILKNENKKPATSGNKVIDFIEQEYEAGNLPFGSSDRDWLIAGVRTDPDIYTKERIQEYINSDKEARG